MKCARIGSFGPLLLMRFWPAYGIVTPYHPVPECAADAPYIVPNFKGNWFKAVEYCHYLGRTLVTIATEQRQQAIDQLLDEAGQYPRDQSYWCGANDLADMDAFHWHLTGRPVSVGWSNWRDELHRREPVANDADAFKVRCVSLSRTADAEVEELQQQVEAPSPVPSPASSWYWTVSNCWKELYFICERR